MKFFISNYLIKINKQKGFNTLDQRVREREWEKIRFFEDLKKCNLNLSIKK